MTNQARPPTKTHEPLAFCGNQAVAKPLSYYQTWSNDVGLPSLQPRGAMRHCKPADPCCLTLPTHSTSSPLQLGSQTETLLVIVWKLCEQMTLEAQGLRVQGPECAVRVPRFKGRRGHGGIQKPLPVSEEPLKTCKGPRKELHILGIRVWRSRSV